MTRRTPLVGKTLRECKITHHVGVTVVGVWKRGVFEVAGPDLMLDSDTVMLLAGSQQAIDGYNEFAIVLYTVTNNGATTLTDWHAGVFCDWDVSPAGADQGRIMNVSNRIRSITVASSWIAVWSGNASSRSVWPASCPPSSWSARPPWTIPSTVVS